MRAYRVWACCVLSVPLLGIVGCSNATYVRKGPETPTNAVTIKNCAANPDTALVAKGDTLTWNIDASDSHTYSIKFPQHTPFSASNVPPGQAQKANGDFWCNTLGGINSNLCLYSYNLVQDGSKTCPDPGVHVH